MSSFDQRVAVVTGAGSGIGRALALALARRGARLALSDVDVVGLGETAGVAEELGAVTAHADAVAALRIEMLEGGHPVQVTCVHPGGIKTSIASIANIANIASNALARARAAGLPVTAADEARQRTYNEKLLRMDPAAAAAIILDGVEHDRPRVLVGNDARAIDVIVRTFPALYQRMVMALGKRMTRAERR